MSYNTTVYMNIQVAIEIWRKDQPDSPQEHIHDKIEGSDNRYCVNLTDLRDNSKIQKEVESKIERTKPKGDKKRTLATIIRKHISSIHRNTIQGSPFKIEQITPGHTQKRRTSNARDENNQTINIHISFTNANGEKNLMGPRDHM